ncbi:hypothetical protein GCM10017557_63520 [Streptomyces aurantiacus]|uniref:Uncharacterized protein n=1 Tax=Streptomyces aurantiacus TaxID=47760 RepID=A0A7G1P6U8_9ACTN|nr:hypothetical protein GCM10017557_63520 [Streptomyces aurantiacus]
MELPPEPAPPAPAQQPESSGASSVPAAAAANIARGLRRLWVRMDHSWMYQCKWDGLRECGASVAMPL